jgi:hypothetical protein
MATQTMIKSNGWHKVTVEGNLITGDTIKCRDFIKSKLGGKWDADRKGWVVDADLLKQHTSDSGTIGSW